MTRATADAPGSMLRFAAMLTLACAILWLARAWFAYELYRTLEHGLAAAVASALAERPPPQPALLATAGLASTAACVALAATIGFARRRTWARTLWLAWCPLLLIAYAGLVLTWPETWKRNIDMAVLWPLSWWLLRTPHRGAPRSP